jgi:hypothetical protein
MGKGLKAGFKMRLLPTNKHIWMVLKSNDYGEK